MPHKSAQKESKLQPTAMPVSPALAGLSLEIKVKAEASPHEATDAENGSSPDSYSPHDSSNPSSEDGSDAVSRNGSNESSPNSSPPKSPESLQTAFPDNEKLKTSNLIDTCLQDQTDPCPTAISGTSSQLDSKAPTLCGSASPTSSDTASTDDSPFGQLSMICDDCLEGGPEVQNVIVWHGGDPDLSTQEYCHIYYKVGAGILSPDSLISSFSATSDQIKYPEGSQNVAAYALPLQEDNCIRTSCDRIENTGRWRREYDGFIDEPKRAGGPNLCSEPHRMIEMDKDNPLRRALEDFILVQTIMSLLTEKKVNPTSMKLTNCFSVLENEDERFPTLMFEATRADFDRTWLQVCREISRILSNSNLGQLNVEIVDPRLYMDSYGWFSCQGDPLPAEYLPSGCRELPEQRLEMRPDSDLSEVGRCKFERVDSSPEGEEGQLVHHSTVKYRVKRDSDISRAAIVKALDNANLPTVGILSKIGTRCGWRG